MAYDSEFAKIYRSRLIEEGLIRSIPDSAIEKARAAQPPKFDPFVSGPRLYMPRKPCILEVKK